MSYWRGERVNRGGVTKWRNWKKSVSAALLLSVHTLIRRRAAVSQTMDKKIFTCGLDSLGSRGINHYKWLAMMIMKVGTPFTALFGPNRKQPVAPADMR